MSPSSLESQIEHNEVHSESQGNLALSSADFSALEDRVARTVQLVRTEREARAAAERRSETLEAELTEQRDLSRTLQEEIRALNVERDHVRQRVEKLLTQLDSLEV